MEKEDPIELPPVWKDLPSLAMPDGSHNFEDDSVFFSLPSLDNPNRTVYGISCYRQIPVEVMFSPTTPYYIFINNTFFFIKKEFVNANRILLLYKTKHFIKVEFYWRFQTRF